MMKKRNIFMCIMALLIIIIIACIIYNFKVKPEELLQETSKITLEKEGINTKFRFDVEFGNKELSITESTLASTTEITQEMLENSTETETNNSINNTLTKSSSNNTSNTISSNRTNNAKSSTYNDEYDDIIGGLVSTINGTTVNKNTNEKVKLTGTDKQKELTKTETKYGVIINTYTTTTFNVYSDGSKTVKSTSNSTEYDRSNYNATTSSLLAEAKSARSKYANMISKVVENTNRYRQEANANSVNGIIDRTNLVLDEKLCIAASVRAVEMAYSGKFSHTRPNGGNIGNELGTKVWGENIARGQKSADSVSRSWRNSAGHYSNMISEKYTKIGVGHFELDGTHYWVQLFA